MRLPLLWSSRNLGILHFSRLSIEWNPHRSPPRPVRNMNREFVRPPAPFVRRFVPGGLQASHKAPGEACFVFAGACQSPIKPFGYSAHVTNQGLGVRCIEVALPRRHNPPPWEWLRGPFEGMGRQSGWWCHPGGPPSNPEMLFAKHEPVFGRPIHAALGNREQRSAHWRESRISPEDMSAVRGYFFHGPWIPMIVKIL